MKMLSLFPLILLMVSLAFSVPQFTQNPSLAQTSPGVWQVQFAVSENTDVEVAIVNRADSSVIRHLAAGVLGVNPPAPLQGGTLTQVLAWDNRDDLGNLVTVPASSITVRVRAGMGARFDKVCGGSPYAFNGTQGLVLDSRGNFFVKGGAGVNDVITTREFEGTGDYVRTVFPYPSNLSAAQISGFGVNNWLNGRYSPKTTRAHGPDLSATIVSKNGTQLLAFEGPSTLIYGSIQSNTMLKIGADGSITGSGVAVKIVTTPAFLGYYYVGGPRYAAVSKDGRFLYLSGIYQTSKFAECCDEDTTPLAPDTGFWRDGRVFRVEMSTGTAFPLISLDSVPVVVRDRIPSIGPSYGGWGHQLHAAIHGTALDDSGRIFICDRLHGRVGVYDTAGVYLGGIPVRYPDKVEINAATGEIYVIARNYNNVCNLYKFPGWRNSPAPVCSLKLTDNVVWNATPSMAVSLSGARPVVWIAYAAFGVRAYRDDGTALTLLRDFAEETRGVNLGFDRVAVDRRNERLYVNDSWAGLYRIEDWAVPRLVPCTTSARQRLTASDLTISNDNQLYIQEGPSYSGPVTRWGIDNHYLDSLPFPNSGRNELTHYIYGRMHGVGGFGEKGLAVAPDKKVAVEYLIGWCPYMVAFFADSGCLDDAQRCDTIITPINLNGWGGGGPAGGLRFDSKGNLYMGAGMRSPEHVIPPGFESDYGYSVHTGAVIRFPAGAKGSIQFVGNVATAAGSDKIYRQGLSPFSSTNECPCRSPRFDIDPYDRLYLPHAVAQKVSVADHNGNTILEFGDYGNWDSRGSGSPVPTPDVPFAWPVGAAATDNFIYVTDMVNTRVVRVSKTFVLDNLPGWPSSAQAGAAALPLALSASPNPFHPSCRINLTMPEKAFVHFNVYDVSGRLVQSLVKGDMKAGRHALRWDGRDDAGRALPAGLYLLKLETKGRTLVHKAMLVR